MSEDDQQSPVLVTGGSGYLAGSIVVELLQRVHRVRTTVRDLAREGAARAIIGRHAPTDRLTVHAANLLADEGWDAAVAGAARVIHVASPMPIREYKGQDLVKPAREGTRRVMEAARRAGVGHVVMTSSIAAALPRAATEEPTDEAVWTDLSDGAIGPYPRPKTLAERDAWALADGSAPAGAPSLTTILPGMVQGPALGPEVSGSLELILRMMTGRAPMLPRVSFAPVDTRDVVDLHVRAMSDPAARGKRVIAAARPLWMREIAAYLKSTFGEKAAKVSTRVSSPPTSASGRTSRRPGPRPSSAGRCGPARRRSGLAPRASSPSARFDRYSLRSSTSSMRWASPLVRIRLARSRVGRTFSRRLARLIVVQISRALACAAASPRVAYLVK